MEGCISSSASSPQDPPEHKVAPARGETPTLGDAERKKSCIRDGRVGAIYEAASRVCGGGRRRRLFYRGIMESSSFGRIFILDFPHT
uniref:PDE8B n=1 Tax=Mesocestoides corti TaxID=53468 RepID=A0A5K3G1N1_MESCO